MLFKSFPISSSLAAKAAVIGMALGVQAGLAGTAMASTVIADWTLNAGPGLPGYGITNPGARPGQYLPVSSTGSYYFYEGNAALTPTAGGQIGGAPTMDSTYFPGYYSGYGSGYYAMANASALNTAVGNNFSLGLWAETASVSQTEYAFMSNNITFTGSLNIGLSGGSWVANLETSSGLVSLGSAAAVSGDAYNLVVNDNSGAFSFVVNGVNVTPGGSVVNATSPIFGGSTLIAIQPGAASGFTGNLSDITIATPAPEPASLVLVALGGLGVLLLKRRKIA